MITLRDAVHRKIQLNQLERQIIDTWEFQRLRRIKQLAMTYLVYPSATHTRFEHAIGTMHLSSLICNQLNLDEELTQKIRLYSLLHDIGHSPFSHESEKVIKKYVGDHEEIGKKKILNGEIADILKHNFNPKEIVQLSESYYGKIISSDIGSDRIDYILRDYHNTGLAYGVVYSDSIIETTLLDQEQEVLALHEEGLEAAESLLIGRFMMFSTVYLHHTVRIASAMLKTAISSAFESNSLTPEEFISSSDEDILVKLKNSNNKTSKKLAKKLFKRELFKTSYSCQYTKELQNNLEKIRSQIKEKFQEDFIIDIPEDILKPTSISVLIKDELRPLGSVSSLVSSLKQAEQSRKKLLFLCNANDKEKLEIIVKNIILNL